MASRGIAVYVRKREPEYTQGGRKSPSSSSMDCRFCVLVEAYLRTAYPRNTAGLLSRKDGLSGLAPCMSLAKLVCDSKHYTLFGLIKQTC